MKQSLMNWFLQLSKRDQGALLLLMPVIIIWLVWQLALSPLAESKARWHSANDGARALLTRVDEKVAKLQVLRASGSAVSQDISTQVSRAAALHNLSVSRLQPNSRGEVQVRLEGVAYDGLMQWLFQLEQIDQLQIVDASITQAGRAGTVNVTVRIAPRV